MNIPENIYSVRYNNNRFLGFNDRTKVSQSLVFAFPNKHHALLVKDRIKEIGIIPNIYYDDHDNFILTKRPNRHKEKLNIENLVVLEHKAKPFIIKLGLNCVDTCIVNNFLEINKFIKFNAYYMISIQEVMTDHVVANLDRIYGLDSADTI
jgi:hypothetical protein